MDDSVDKVVLNKLAGVVQDIKVGLDPEIITHWYKVIEEEAKQKSPPELCDTIKIVQDPVLWMKFEIKASRRVVKYIIDAIEKNLNSMPFATRLYFQKVEEIIEAESRR